MRYAVKYFDVEKGKEVTEYYRNKTTAKDVRDELDEDWKKYKNVRIEMVD